jgi:hypothetical protein
MKTGIELITEERERQMAPPPNPNRGNHTWPQTNGEGYDHKHDDSHSGGELAFAAVGYALHAAYQSATKPEYKNVRTDYVPVGWPWEAAAWKPSSDRIRNLVKAGALISAEIDRLQREASAEPANEKS